jgi:molybdate-binding protein
MIDNQHRKIKGYRDLTETEISAMNTCKKVAVDVGILCDEVASMPGVDQRWVAIAKTDLQKGFMALIRSIARPETF